MEQAAGEAPDIANAQNRAGYSHGQHGYGLYEALGPELPLDHQIGDDHTQQRRNGGGDQAQDERIPESLKSMVAGEDQLEPLACQREELEAPGGEAGPDGHAQVHHDDENGNQCAQNGQRDLYALIRNEHPAPGGLARQGGGSFALQIILLDGKHTECDAQQHHGHGCGAGFVVGAGDL